MNALARDIVRGTMPLGAIWQKGKPRKGSGY
jgi:hypothetical protein